ncbi:hypothetical protein FACS1894190_01550 [Spirochaetia bacterium]|nr:hypothetical protein FACS1894190_01550 [Spirochaetia bacterium]
MKNNTIYEKPIMSICFCLIFLFTLILLAVNSTNNESFRNDNIMFSISFKHYGINSMEMERTIAMPLEDRLSLLTDIKSLITTSENGETRAYMYFKKNNNKLLSHNKIDARYEAIRDIAQSVYETLPRSAQRPVINSSAEFRNPVWTAALYNKNKGGRINSYIEKKIKPVLSSINGVAEVEIYGFGINEIIITPKPDKIILNNLTASDLAYILGSNDVFIPAGSVKEKTQEIFIAVDGRFNTLEELKSAIIPLPNGNGTKLENIATVEEKEREPDIISRLDGKKTILISIIPVFGTDIRQLSKKINNEIKMFSNDIDFNILSDNGNEEEKAYRSVLMAALQGALVVALITILIMKKNGSGIVTLLCALIIPYICIASALMMIAIGLPLDKNLFIGISAGIGSAVDTTIICCEQLNRLNTTDKIRNKMSMLKIPIVSGTLTTAITFLPVFTISFSSKIILVLGIAIIIVNVISMILGLFVVPTIFSYSVRKRSVLRNTGEIKNKYLIKKLHFIKVIFNRLKRKAIKLFSKTLFFCFKKPIIICFATLTITVAGIIAVAIVGTDSAEDETENTLYIQAQFISGLRANEIDNIMAEWTENINKIDGIINVQTGARVASSTVLIKFNPKAIRKEKIKEIIRASKLSNGFFYISENGSNDRNWVISISGDDNKKCIELAKEAANRMLTIPIVKDTILNFKDGPKQITFSPNRSKINELNNSVDANIRLLNISETLRWGVHGPVAYKRIASNNNTGDSNAHETDVRIKGWTRDVPTLSMIKKANIPVSLDGTNSSISIEELTTTNESTETSIIRREDRRRVASISIRTNKADPRKIRSIVMPELNKINKPAGYSIDFDRTAIDSAETLTRTIFYFIFSILLCYMIIAALNESFIIPVLAIAVIPPSIAIPAVILSIFGYSVDAGIACAFVAVCGLTVNSSLLVLDNIRSIFKKNTDGENNMFLFMYKKIRRMLPLLSGTTITTITASFPFLFISESSNRTVRVLSLVTILGVGASCLFSIYFIPSFTIFIKKHFHRVRSLA